jgi:uncharacterized membrane protein
MATSGPQLHAPKPTALAPFRRAVLRGLGVVLPPLLTIAIFVWVGNTVANYILYPLEEASRYLLVTYQADIRQLDEFPEAALIDGRPPQGGIPADNGEVFVQAADGLLIPQYVRDEVRANLGKTRMPDSAVGVYERYFDQRWYFKGKYGAAFAVVKYIVFIAIFVLLLYLLGKFLAAGVGRFFWSQLERFITNVPLVRNVYSSVKQVTDVLFNEASVEFNRVVAIEYPRKGIWTIAFVTSESMLDIRAAANEPVLAVLVPTSPMPFTGFTMTVRKSETVDLDITIDQALQFIVSCGVVVPPQQLVLAESVAKPQIPQQ